MYPVLHVISCITCIISSKQISSVNSVKYCVVHYIGIFSCIITCTIGFIIGFWPLNSRKPVRLFGLIWGNKWSQSFGITNQRGYREKTCIAYEIFLECL